MHNRHLLKLCELHAEIEQGHVQLETDMQVSLDAKDAELAIVYRTLRRLQQHAHQLHTQSKQTTELISILQAENMVQHIR